MTVSIEIHPTRPDRIAVTAAYRYKDLIKSCPGARWSKEDGYWSVPLAWTACLAMRGIFRDELVVGDQLTQWSWQHYETMIKPAMALREAMDAPGDDQLFTYQRAGVAWLKLVRRALLMDEMGCLAGDTIVTINRGGAARKYRLDEAVKRFESSWDPSIPTKIGRHEDGVVRLATVSNMWCSGKKQTFTVTTESGRTIRATDEHPFETPEGWKRLDELEVGKQVYVNLGKGSRGRAKIYYAQTFEMDNHPHRSWWASKYWAVPTHRVVAEATLNNIDVDVFLDKIRGGDTAGLDFLDPQEFAVHHNDHNPLNNTPENLLVLTHTEHARLHAMEGTSRNVLDQVGVETVVSIEAFGEELTYDIEVADDPHNFLANGFVVHNTGKTVQSTVAMRELANEQAFSGPILIVCPNTMKGTWRNELAKWWPEVEAIVIGGTAAQRVKQFKLATEAIAEGRQVALVINWEALRFHSRLLHFGSTALKKCVECGGEQEVKTSQCEAHDRELNTFEFGAVIADEIHRALDPHSKQTRALRAASGAARVRFGLTGTPISKDPTQLWTILNWIDEQEWPTKSAWVERMVDYVHNVFGGMEVNGLHPVTQGEFRQTVDPRTRRMLKEVVLPFLPPLVPETRRVEMNPKQKKQYNEMTDLLVAKLDNGTLVADNSMVQVGRLVQLASSCGDIQVRQEPVYETVQIPKLVTIDGVVYQDVDYTTGELLFEGTEKRQKIDPETGQPVMKDVEYMVPIDPSCKLDAFMGDLDDFAGQSVAVFAESRQLIEMLSARLTKKGIAHGLITGSVTESQRTKVIEQFQNGDFQFCLITIKAGGTGITLTRASVSVFLQRNWSPIEMEQAYARTHRIGSEQHPVVTRIDYITEGTVEDDQIAVLANKGEMIEEIVRDREQLRKLIKGGWAAEYWDPAQQTTEPIDLDAVAVAS